MGYESFLGVNIWTALFTLANTVAIYLTAKKYLFGPVMDMIHRRQQEIDDLYANAAAAKEGAQALETEYKAKLAVAAETSEKLVQEAVIRGQARQEEILRQATAEAGAIRAKASADIAQEKKKALNDAKDEISDIALAIAGKVVGQEMNQQRQNALVERFLEELGELQ